MRFSDQLKRKMRKKSQLGHTYVTAKAFSCEVEDVFVRMARQRVIQENVSNIHEESMQRGKRHVVKVPIQREVLQNTDRERPAPKGKATEIYSYAAKATGEPYQSRCSLK